MEHVSFSGPFFDLRGEQEMHEWSREALDVAANQGYSYVMQNLETSIRHPTPYYQTQQRILDRPPDSKVINDRGIIYGPWLEGTGSKNKTTRFKGYGSYRRAAQELRTELPNLLEPVTRRAVEKLNGR